MAIKNALQSSKYRMYAMWSVLLAVMILALVVFSVKTSKTARTDTEESLIITAQKCADRLSNQIALMNAAAKPVAEHIEREDVHGEEAMIDFCRILERQTMAEKVLICSENGTCYWNDGETLRVPEKECMDLIFDTSEEHSFRWAKDEEQSLLICIPFEKADEAWAVVMFYNLDYFDNLVNPLVSDTNAFVALISQNGDIYAKNNEKTAFLEQDKLYDFATNNSAVNAFATRIKSRSVATLSTSIGNDKRTLVAAPFGQGNVAVVVGYPENYVEKKVSQRLKDDKALLWELSLVLVIVACLLIWNAATVHKKHDESEKNLEERADTDLLTGMNNKLATERKIKNHLEVNPEDQCMMVLMDLDNFKKINDTMGHAFGDEVLSSLGSQISSIFRVTDIRGRIGGDEFMVFLKGMGNKEDILKQSKKITDFFDDFKAGTYVKYSSTASIGVSLYPKDGKTFEELYKAADSALYKAKKRGKNQLAYYDESFLEE